jgi:hypothetical protein
MEIRLENATSGARASGRIESGTPPPDRIVQLGLGFCTSKTLLSALELGLFTECAALPEELRHRLGLQQRVTGDFFDAVVTLGMLDRCAGVCPNTLAS